MPDISIITLPSGSKYTIKDSEARKQITDIKNTTNGVMTYIGATTTEISDGDTVSPVMVGTGDNAKEYIPEAGDVVVYNNVSFAWTGDQWDQYGSAGAIKGLAYKDIATGKVTAQGTISQPTFTGDKGSVTVSGTPKGAVTIATGDGIANYTPEGTVSVSPNVLLNTTTVNSITGVGTLPQWTASVQDENLILSWSAGSLPTKGIDTVVATDIKSATATGSFTGTGVELKGTFTGQESSSTGAFTPSGTVSTPVFTGTAVDVTVE